MKLTSNLLEPSDGRPHHAGATRWQEGSKQENVLSHLPATHPSFLAEAQLSRGIWSLELRPASSMLDMMCGAYLELTELAVDLSKKVGDQEERVVEEETNRIWRRDQKKIVTGGIWSRGPIPLGRRPKLTVRFHVFSARGFVARHVSPSKFWKPPERATLIPSSLLVSSSSALPDCHLPRFPSLAVASTQIRKTLGQRTGIRNTARNSGARATRSTSMEKKELLGVRKSPPLTKRRRKVTAGGAGGGSMAKAIAAYLASDSFMYAPLVSNSPPPPPPPPSSPPAGGGSSDKMVALVQKYRGSWRGALAFNIEESEHQRRQRLAAWRARCATSDCHLYSCCDQEMLMINRVQANAEHMLLQPEPCLRWIVQIVEPHKQQAQLLTHGWAPGAAKKAIPLFASFA
uniref:Uncharacterized protein n=1 Tax=Oryza nivara TaxID=4536 RepID=A0A0E0ICL5_ORYNI